MKRWLCISAGFGAGAVAMAAVLIGGIDWFSSRPKPWNDAALSVVSSKAAETFSFEHSTHGERFQIEVEGKPEELPDAKFAGFSLTYALQNNTAQDITLAENVVIMKCLAKGKTLGQIGFAKPYSSYFIPAHQRAEFSMKLDVGCTEYSQDNIAHARDPKVCFSDNFGSADGFVLFDHTQRLEVFLPKPALE